MPSFTEIGKTGGIKRGSELGLNIAFSDRGLQRDLAKLNFNLQRKLVRKAIRPAVKLFQKAAKQKAPKDTGALRRSIKVRALRAHSKGILGVRAITGQGFFVGEQYYGAFLEFGTKHITERRFLRDAFDENEKAAEKMVMTALRQMVDQALRA